MLKTGSLNNDDHLEPEIDAYGAPKRVGSDGHSVENDNERPRHRVIRLMDSDFTAYSPKGNSDRPD